MVKKNKLGNVVFNLDAFCEHCLQLEPYTATVAEDAYRDVEWCLGCASVNSMELGAPINDILKQEVQLKVNYFEKQLYMARARVIELSKG